MKVYHSSWMEIAEPDLKHSRTDVDFGKGFYTTTNFEQEVLQSSQPVMVDFFANWCGPCQMMGPVIANLAEEYAGKIKIGKINVDENPGVAQAYDVATIPNLVFFKDGKVVNRVIGVVPDNVLKEKLDALLK